MVDYTQLTVEQLIEYYMQLRKYTEDLKDSIKKPLDDTAVTMKDVADELENRMRESGTTKLASKDGTAFTTTKRSYKIDNPVEYAEFVKNNMDKDISFVKFSFSKHDMDAFVEANKALPDGVIATSSTHVSVRKK